MAASHGGPLIVPVTVRWSDLDAYGHVNNAAVVTLLEEARVAALWRTGRPGEAPSNAVPGGPDAPVCTFVVRQEIEHRAPLDIIADIETLEGEIAKGLVKLKAMLS